MVEPLILEILDRHGRVAQRQKFMCFPVHVGRDYSNDLIVDDEAVSARHLSIEPGPEGGWVVEDLASENGSYASNRDRISLKRINIDERIRIGRTQLQFRSPQSAIAPTVLQGGLLWRVSQLLGNVWIMLLLLALNVGLLTWSSNTHVFTQIKPSDTAVTAGTLLLGTLLWASIWALLARLLNHRAVLFEYISLGSILALASLLLQAFETRLGYLAHDSAPALITSSIVWLVVMAVMAYLHLKLATALSRRKLYILIGTGLVVMCGFLLLSSYRDEHTFSRDLPFNNDLQLLPLSVLKLQPAGRFFDDLSDVRDSALQKTKDPD
ncbi:FHA domain-containing protein [Silvimonas iriomotensis]|uniref:FHA domain-containing protein n=1 Tax=Silvimonas iriomotensis TaxID=449662 RepID=A0ABQ2P454_9NEIS|nr:FHA domain-containing protein [Silvimonas iriomotensis]GGP17674.1 hypothetical protein GCM10010970_00910 [Silvimonas iriomotensis]